MKHIRGILFDDAEKKGGKSTNAQANNKNQSIHLEIKPVKVTKPTSTVTTATAAKRSRSSQDDSAISYKIMSNDSYNRIIQNKFDVVSRCTSTE